MPVTSFGEKIKTIDSLGGTPVVKLTKKGESVHFRLAGTNYAFEGKHFLRKGDSWEVVVCPRISSGGECEHCNAFFALKKKVKDLKAKGTDASSINKLSESVRKSSPQINFYFPILDRKDGVGKVLKTTLSVRLQLEDEARRGIKLLNYDYLLERTERPGSDFYKLTRFDSSETKPLTESEKQILEEMARLDLDSLLSVRSSSKLFDEEVA